MADIVRYTLHDLAGRGSVVGLLSALKKARSTGVSRVELDVADIGAIYPNGAVPATAIIDFHRSLGLDVRFVNIEPGSFFEHARVRNPFFATENHLNAPGNRLNVVWAYTEETAVPLTNCIMQELVRRLEFGEGVYNALNWCLYEVLDNVFQHSGNEVGFFMAQIHRNSKKLTFCVADSGIGVHRSFHQGGKYRPPTAFDALTLAVREGVSRTGDKRGNGLFGLKGVVEANGGRLELASGRGILTITPSGIEGRNENAGIIIDQNHHCTVVDFSLDVGTPVNLGEILGAPIPDDRLEAIESTEGEYVIPLIEHAQGTGTRAAAEALRNYLMNYLHEGAPRLVLDFAGVPMVSSSFADETIGKLAERFGPIGFSQRFQLINMNSSVQMLLDRAIALRISELYYRDDTIPTLDV